MDSENKNKYDLLLHLLSEGDAMVCLDARNPQVEVPPQHKANPKLSLIFNLNFKRPIEVTTEGIEATLSFNGRSHKCVLPFTAVWAIYEPSTQKGQIWEECIPKDANLIDQILKQTPQDKPKASTTPKTAKKPPWRKKETEESGTKKDRSHLRVIK